MTPDAVLQRSTGAYYTPQDAAAFMADWVVEGRPSLVLEPSFGDGVFIEALRAAAEVGGVQVRVAAVEKGMSAFAAFSPWAEGDIPIQADFHELEPFPVDAVIGNPPFVRFRHLTAAEAQVALAAGHAALGTPVDNSGSTWMTFVLHAATFIRPGGRMALVLPADALYVRYGRPFWAYVAERFGSLRVVRCRERIFGDLLQDVVILLAAQSGGSTDTVRVELYESRSAITAGSPSSIANIPTHHIMTEGKPFTAALLGEQVTGLLDRLQDRISRIGSLVKFNIGYVDGNKRFFHPSPKVAQEFRLPEKSLLPALRSGRYWTASGPFTSQLPSSSLMNLWLPDPADLAPGERRYIASGEKKSVHKGYKTAIRNPWYVVPGVKVPDIVVPTFGSVPKLMVNDGGYMVSNSVMAGYWRSEPRPVHLLGCWYTSMTRLGIELAVHSLGGGVLVLVPRECDAILIPTLLPEPPTDTVMDKIQNALSEGDVSAAYDAGDAYLVSHGWSLHDLEEAKKLADSLQAWREER